MENKKYLGEFIYQMRKEKNISQSQLGDMLGVSNKAVSKWETGESNPEIEKIQKLAGIFGISADELLSCERKADGPESKTDDAGYIKIPVSGKFEYTSKKKTKKGVPLVHINFSSFKAKARGIVAIGYNAKGVVSIGILSVGIVAIGVLNIGVISLGALAVSLLASVGSISVSFGAAAGAIALGGFLAVGAIAIGYNAIGAVAIGYNAHTSPSGIARGINEFIHSEWSGRNFD
ncbi:MAG: helix-turn-helix domain-containing protein [Clostridiales bacterium]|jgi:transcriptional regulator with XRE-family HTH domain|nr:helix-turn-helix domain-containing protein [Clostridiales bacterium]